MEVETERSHFLVKQGVISTISFQGSAVPIPVVLYIRTLFGVGFVKFVMWWVDIHNFICFSEYLLGKVLVKLYNSRVLLKVTLTAEIKIKQWKNYQNMHKIQSLIFVFNNLNK